MSPEPPGTWPPDFVGGRADREALVVLAHLEGIRPLDLHALAWREGSAAACLAAVLAGKAGSHRDRRVAARLDPAVIRDALARCGGRMAAPGDEEYPPALLDLPDPPVCLFARGGRLVPWPLAIGLVGARASSAYGREVAHSIGAGVAAAGVVVVSGAARGIDAAAHHGALSVSGVTAAVLGSGIDVLYPYRNRHLIEEIGQAGTLLSEYPPGVPPEKRRFPARNRIIAALSRSVVVVEGAPGSGSLLTAEFGLDLNRDVLAVPGQVAHPLSAVPHELIRDGATLVRGPDDVLLVLGVQSAAAASSPSIRDQPVRVPAIITAAERRVLDNLSGAGETLDSVASAAGLPASATLAALASLELHGLVRGSGGRYERTAAAGP